MSNPDSFIDEVTEEVRRDRLFALFRKYGWIGVLVILMIVGGAGWREWTKARAEARAEAFGDALLDAVDLGVGEERLQAFSAIPSDGGQLAVQDLLLASAPLEDREAALVALDRLAQNAQVPQVYRDLAVLRRVLILGPEMPLADRRVALQGLDVAGRPLRVLAEEQLAYLLVEEGKPDEALVMLAMLYQEQETPGAMLERLEQMILALGGAVPERVAPAAPVDAG